MEIVIDAETESPEDIKLGAYAYCSHPHTDTLCVSWRPLHSPSGTERIWYPGKRVNPLFLFWKMTGEHGAKPAEFIPSGFEIPAELRKAINEGAHFWAHNAFFEQCWWKLIQVKKYGWPEIPADRWHCSAALAAYYGYSQSLERSCLAVGTKIAKDTEGGSLMKKMSPVGKRTKKILGEWSANLHRLGQYCKIDVAAEAELILALPPLPAEEQKIWLLDQKINFLGLPLDRELVAAGAESSDLLQADAIERLPVLTGGAVKKPGEIAKIQKWVAKKTGKKLPNLQAGTVSQILDDPDTDADVAEVLRIRQDAGTAAIKKYTKESAAIEHVPDSRFRGGFVFYGAHTGRWTGRIVQPTNMPRAHFSGEKETEAAILAIKWRDLDVMQEADQASLDTAREKAEAEKRPFDGWRASATNTLTKCVRSSITAPKGRTFVAADWAGIELRVLTWFARDKSGLDRIVSEGSSQLYLDMAKSVFGKTILKSDTFEYTVGKAGRLGCGYGMGPYARKFDGDGTFTPLLDEYGRPYGGFVEYARNYGINITPAMLELAEKVVKVYRSENKKVVSLWYACHEAAVSVVETGYPEEVNGVKFSMRRGALVLRLPSGRELFYAGAKVEERKGRKSLSYWGDKSGKWLKMHLYGGLIVENIVQAMSRDILTPAMVKIDAAYDVTSHCYDEIVCEVPLDKAEGCAIFMDKTMCEALQWAKGLPLETEIWKGKRYKK